MRKLLKVLGLLKTSKKRLTIRIPVDEPYSSVNLRIRHTLAHTLEERGIGDVWNQGMTEDYMELNVDLESFDREEEIKSILKALNLLEGCDLIYE